MAEHKQQTTNSNKAKKEKTPTPKKNAPKDPVSGKPTGPKFTFNFYWIYAIIAVGILGIQFINMSGGPKQITWQEFERSMLKDHDVDRIVIVNKDVAEVYLKKEKRDDPKYKDVSKKPFGGNDAAGPQFQFKIGSVETFKQDLKDAQTTYGFKEDEKISIDYLDRSSIWPELLNVLLPIVVIVIIWMFIMKRMSGGGGPGGQLFNIGKSKATLFDKDLQVKTTFNDVAGLEEAKVEVMEIVDFLKNPKKYTTLGGKIPRGALLVGPPGTGKTLLAKAVAGEAQVPFFSLSGSDFVEMFVGVGASRVRDLFRQAKEKAPCIIFIDEIDAIGRARGKGASFSANDERESTLNQLLTEMDGFGTNSGVIILAATNRADVLDRALLRPGRFDRQIFVELPDINGRKEIFAVHLQPLKINDTVQVDFLAKQTPGFSGADIANVCNEAALIAARKGKDVIEKQDFLDAVDRIIGGLEKKNKIITPHEKKVIAYHEAGHASVSWLLEHAHPLVKVTIVPRGNALGAAWYLPEERQITTTAQIMDEICAALGGRAAEQVTFGAISTGALSDLEKTTKQAYAMVSIYGLNEKIGHISFYDSSGQNEYNFNKPYSEKTAQVIDEEVSKLIEGAYAKTVKLLSDNRDKLDKLAKVLLEKEVIFKEDLEEIFGKRTFAKDIADLIASEAEEQIKLNGATLAPTAETVESVSTPPVDNV